MKCPNCGYKNDRDMNAALNLKLYKEANFERYY